MPITGEFLSDFTAFIKGAKDADQAVEGLEKRGGEFGQAFSAAFQGLDIQGLLNDPLGEAASIAEGFVEFLPPMAQGAVAAAAAIGAMATASFALANAAADVGENLGDIAAKTGATVPEISRLSNAAAVAGVDLNTVSSAIFNMNKAMAERPVEFGEGLRAIGISAQQFNELRQDEKFYAVARALEATTNAGTKAKVGSDLLGRSYVELAGDLGDILSAQEQIEGMDVWTTAQAAQAEAFQMAVNKLKLEFQGTALAIGRDLIPMMTEVVKSFKDIPAIQNYAGSLALVRAAFDELDTRVRTFQGTIAATAPPVEGADKVVAGLTATVQANAFALQSGATAAERTAFGMERLKEMTKEDEEASRAAAAEKKKFAEAMAELDAAGEGWQGTLQNMNGDVVEAIKYYLDAGVSQAALATAFGRTAVEIKAVAAARKAEGEAAKEQEKLVTDSLKATMDAQAEYDRTVREGSNNTTQAQIENIYRVADEQINALARQGIATEESWNLILKTADENIRQLTQKTLEQDKGTRAYYQNMRDDAAAAYQFALQHAEQYTAGRLEQLRREAEAADFTLADWQAAAEKSMQGAVNAADQAGAAMDRLGSKVKQTAREMADEAWATAKSFTELANAMGLEKKARDEQRNASAGLTPNAIIGRNGVPLDMYGRPVAGLGAISNLPVVNVSVAGNLIGTEQELARLIGNAVTGNYSKSGNKLPV